VSRPRLELVVLDAAGDGVELRCPGPGRVRWDRGPGEVLVGGSLVGTLVRDERAYTLAVPAGVRGAVVGIALPHQWNPCGHGALLATLSTAIADGNGFAAQTAGAGPNDGPRTAGQHGGRPLGSALGADARGAAADGVWEVRSPTHGTFYTRPAPGAAPYAAPGTTVESGQTVGLVEVMKCFSPILFDGAPFGRGVVRDVLVADGAEVRADQPLRRIAAS
jgi:acetyl-CoA carboxylase biotin carboxyl carrier protein